MSADETPLTYSLERYQACSEEANAIFSDHLYGRFSGGDSLIIAAMIIAAIMLNVDDGRTIEDLTGDMDAVGKLAMNVYRNAKAEHEARQH